MRLFRVGRRNVLCPVRFGTTHAGLDTNVALFQLAKSESLLTCEYRLCLLVLYAFSPIVYKGYMGEFDVLGILAIPICSIPVLLVFMCHCRGASMARFKTK